MIYIVFSDRLGNNLFQFAAAISLNKEVTICLTNPDEVCSFNSVKDVFFKDIPVIYSIPPNIPVYEELSFNYAKIPYLENNDIVLKGYFQSHKYIDRNIVLSYYGINADTLNYIQCHFPYILSEKFTCIHVRRGDYLIMPFKHPFCGLKYYNEAIKLIGKTETYVVISDDIKWCKKNIKAQNIYYIENSNIIVDFYIQTFCKNNIISNSSYSWWGAYLNQNDNRIVIAPKRWFGSKFKVDITDLLPKTYIIVKNGDRLKIFVDSILIRAKSKFLELFS